jgi:AraC family transcriptional activator of mtrCDE
MTASLLKQVILTLLRRSLITPQLWSERFPILSDPQIARAFARMIANPGDQHTTQSLSLAAGLSRSAFMSRFTKAIGVSPLAALRQLRMRQAARLVEANTMPIEQIAKAVGYVSRSSFSRAFRVVYGVDPSEYRSMDRSRGEYISAVGNEHEGPEA